MPNTQKKAADKAQLITNELHITLPESSPYQCGRDFILCDEGWFSWEGAGRFEGDWCAFEYHRTVEQATADAVFRLAIADGQDWAEAILTVKTAGLPTDHLDLDNIDYP